MRENTQKLLKIDIHQPVHFNWSGLFTAPNDQWVHLHRRLLDFELMVIQRGVLYIEDDEGQHEVREGEYILMNPSQVQRGYRPSDCSFYWMHFTPYIPDAYEVFEEESDRPVFQVRYVVIPKTGKLSSIDRVYILMQQLSDMEKRYMDAEANAFLATSVLCEIQNQYRYVKKQKTEKDTILYEKISDYIARHIAEDLQVRDVAEQFGYNEKYLTTCFQKKYHISLKQYIIAAKMERAKFLLCNTNASITEIAYNLSYWNVQSFSAAFRKCTETTPTEYRRLYSGGRKNDA